MGMRFARAGRLAAAMTVGGVLAVAAGCTSSAGNGTSNGAPPSARTLNPAAGGGAHPDAAWPTYGRDFARTSVAAGVGAAGAPRACWRADLHAAVHRGALLGRSRYGSA